MQENTPQLSVILVIHVSACWKVCMLLSEHCQLCTTSRETGTFPLSVSATWDSSPCAGFFQRLSFWCASLILLPSCLQPFPIISFSLCQSPGDSWLDITAQDFERLLQERSGGRADVGSPNCSSTEQQQHAEEGGEETEHNTEGDAAGFSLVAISQGMKNFLMAMSSHEGAELPWW